MIDAAIVAIVADIVDCTVRVIERFRCLGTNRMMMMMIIHQERKKLESITSSHTIPIRKELNLEESLLRLGLSRGERER